ncbi:MAG: putative YhdH/YhfP family quinone oxidoreductase [Flavobacteriales bacterium]|jgi:acrylyl-CoA reductase (NADPH)
MRVADRREHPKTHKMTTPNSYRALVVRETSEGKFERNIEQVSFDFLPKNEVLIQVKFAGLNYKDALSASGHKGVTRHFPHTPGVDAAGIVVSDSTGQWKPGQEVICTSHDLGMNTPGGFAEYISVPAEWIVALPEEIDLKTSMVLGTAAYTAGLALWKMERNGQSPEMGSIAVTGSTGGVGSMAIALLHKAGYNVLAVTGKPNQAAYLKSLGANEIIDRSEVDDQSGKPLLRPRWAGAIDNVGGNTLATLLKGCGRNGNVAAIGLVGGSDLSSTVFPFILNGVNLLGVDSAETPSAIRQEVWNRLASSWKLDLPEASSTLCSLEEVTERMDKLLNGNGLGRVVAVL